RNGACKPLSRARIDNVRGLVVDDGLHVVYVAHEIEIAPGGEMTRRARTGFTHHQGASLAFPFRKAAVQHAHLVGAHDAEHPPYPRRAEHAVPVVDHDPLTIADPHLAHARGELLRRWQHMGEWRVGVGDLVDI